MQTSAIYLEAALSILGEDIMNKNKDKEALTSLAQWVEVRPVD